MDATVNFHDRYNWDAEKDVDVFGIGIWDEWQGNLSEAGLAQNFDMTGTSSTRSTNGIINF